MKNIGGNSIVIKEVNINLVRKTLKKKRQGTKQEIAKITGLSVVTVGTMLQHLIKENEVIEVELASSNGGRPAHQFRYNNLFSLALTLFPYEADGCTIVRNVIVDLWGERIYEKESKVENINLNVFEDIITPLIETYPAIKAIGLGLPGVEADGKMIASDYKEMEGLSIAEYFKELYKIPIVIENDVNAAVVGFGKDKESISKDTIVYLYFPDKYPPGSGILLSGNLYKGKSNFAGEVASMPLDIIWNEELYNSFDKFCAAIVKLIISISSLLNPERIVLNGNTLRKEHISRIVQECDTRLPKNMVPEIYLSDKFISDYQRGLIIETLERLDSNIELRIK